MSNLKLDKPIYLQGPYIALPKRVITNQDLIEFTKADVKPSVISFSSGIRCRHWVEPEQACSDLAIAAITNLFEAKQVDKDNIKQLILATISGDYVSPPTSPLIQHQLGLKNVGAFDIAAACAGFVVGLHNSAALAQAMSGSVLLAASEIRSKFLNPNDFGTSVLFGDGAAACLLSQNKTQADFELFGSSLYSDGEVGDLVSIPAGGSRLPAAENREPSKNYINVHQNSSLFIKAVEGMVECGQKFMKDFGISRKDIDWLVPHQGNKHLIHAVANQLGFDNSNTVNIIETTGNTSGASVGLALDALRQNSALQSGDKVLVVAAGGGGIAAAAYLGAI